MEVVPLCELLTEQQEAQALLRPEFGGAFGQLALRSVVEKTLKEVLEDEGVSRLRAIHLIQFNRDYIYCI